MCSTLTALVLAFSLSPCRLAEAGDSESARTARGSNALADAQRTAAQTADIGTSILTQLGSQREQLISARSSMQGANQQLADARKNITTMFRRATTKKCIIYGIIIGLCGTIVLVLISKFSRR